MESTFKRDLNNNYMILNSDNNISIEDYRVRMLVSNKMPCLLKCNLRSVDGLYKFYYEITSKQPLTRILEKKKIQIKDLKNILSGFIKVMDSLSEYLLETNDLYINPEYIYMDLENGEMYFCYIPGLGNDLSVTFNELTSYILNKVDHDDKQAVLLAYEIYRRTLEDNYSLESIITSINMVSNIDIDDNTGELVDNNEYNNNYENTSRSYLKEPSEPKTFSLFKSKNKTKNKNKESNILSSEKLHINNKNKSEKAKLLTNKNKAKNKTKSIINKKLNNKKTNEKKLENFEETSKKRINKFSLILMVISGLILISFLLLIIIYLPNYIQNPLDSEKLMRMIGVALILVSILSYIIYTSLKSQKSISEDDYIIESELNKKGNLYASNSSKKDNIEKDISNGELHKNGYKEIFNANKEQIEKDIVCNNITVNEKINGSNKNDSKVLFNNLNSINYDSSVGISYYTSHAVGDDLYNQNNYADNSYKVVSKNMTCESNHFEINDNKNTVDNQTTMLLAYRPKIRKLIGVKEIYKDFTINSNPFILGKMKGCVDCIIPDELVSRIHAEIRKIDDKYYLTDLNSTNGTFYNGKRLEANETVEIKEEDTIILARAEYIFR